MIAVIDYGMGNIHSVQKAIQLFGEKAVITDKKDDILSCAKAVLPGVGAFDDAMEELKKRGLLGAISNHIKSKKPFLGICLGMQILFKESQEARKSKGLGIFGGSVKKFDVSSGIRVPHMGWNQLEKISNDCLLLKDIPEGAFVYFCHSYFPEVTKKSISAAVTEYGVSFASCVWSENVYGVQFHPEKSQRVGLKIMENFVKLC